MKNVLLSLLSILAFSTAYSQKTLKATADSVHMKFFISDWDNVPEVEARVVLEDISTGSKFEFTSDIDGRYELLVPKNTTYRANVYRFDTTFAFNENDRKELKIPDMAYLTYKHQYRIKIMQEMSSSQSAEVNNVEGGPKAYKRIFNLNVLFSSAEWDLDNGDKKELDKLVKQLQENPSMRIELAAHTDNVGDDASNMRLSQQRANSVRDYVVDKGIALNRLMPKGYGEKKPIATNDTAEGRKLNRRTECRVINE